MSSHAEKVRAGIGDALTSEAQEEAFAALDALEAELDRCIEVLERITAFDEGDNAAVGIAQAFLGIA